MIQHSLNPDDESIESIINIALRIHSVSAKAYSILVEELNFPSIHIVRYRFEKSISNFPEKLIHLENVNDVVQIEKEKKGISKIVPFDSSLSVDAIYFTPDVSITDEAILTGIEFGESGGVVIPPNIFKIFANDMTVFDNFLHLNSCNVVKAWIVFQIQPKNAKFKTFIVHILPSSNGKSNENVV